MNKRKNIFWFFVFLALALLSPPPASGAQGHSGPLPPAGLVSRRNPIEIANLFIGTAYRYDGVLDEEGRFTLFEDQQKVFDTPGLNCSGLVLALSRYLLKKNLTVEEVQRDRQGDSGPDSEYGENWDYGWDLILNISEGQPRRVIMPDGGDYPIDWVEQEKFRGFEIHQADNWPKVLAQMKPGRFYLAGFSKEVVQGGQKRVLHYHVGIFLVDDRGRVFLYQTTHNRSHAYRIQLTARRGLRRFIKSFGYGWGGPKKMLIIEVKMPEQGLRQEASSD